jgi:acyl-CoA synthetase (AMP-forming)/AMP-acid ligase II
MLDQIPDTIPRLVQAAAEARGPAPALVERGETWSFSRLWQESRAAISAMLAYGVRQGDRVAIWAPNRREWILAAVGAMGCGAAIIPVNTRLKPAEASDILIRTRSKLLMTMRDFLGVDYVACLNGATLPDLENIVALDAQWSDFLSKGGGAFDPAVDDALDRLTADHVCDIMFTSGTTGLPKGVISTHGRVIPMFDEWARHMALGEGERYLIINPFFHTFGYKAGWVAALLAGATIYPMASFDPVRVIQHIEEDRINFLPGPPTIFHTLLAAKRETPFDCSSLRGAATGAATVPPELIRRMRAELGLVDTVTAYGMTECPAITACRRGDHVELIAESCGKALAGLELRVVDDEGLPCATGTSGEILVRGYGVMVGYLDDPDATAAAIDADGWLHTGDVGTLDADGYLRITDRKKDMFISGGFNVYPAEVEKRLSGHPGIAQVAVIGVADARLGEVGKAFLVLRPGSGATVEDIAGWAREQMANFKAPRYYEVVQSLPINAAGKVMKDLLRR